MFEPLHCVNFGIGGDQTQHVLWRVLNGEMDNVEPKVCKKNLNLKKPLSVSYLKV